MNEPLQRVMTEKKSGLEKISDTVTMVIGHYEWVAKRRHPNIFTLNQINQRGLLPENTQFWIKEWEEEFSPVHVKELGE